MDKLKAKLAHTGDQLAESASHLKAKANSQLTRTEDFMERKETERKVDREEQRDKERLEHDLHNRIVMPDRRVEGEETKPQPMMISSGKASVEDDGYGTVETPKNYQDI